MKAIELKEFGKQSLFCRLLVSLVLAVGVQALMVSSLQAATAKMEVTDSGITSAVEDRLSLETDVLVNNVDVTTRQGMVTLSGSVENLLDKERAVTTVNAIRGVREVVDNLTVDGLARPDTEILTDIQTSLREDPATESYQTIVSVQDAVVTLTGSVGSNMEKQLATRIASGVKGVKSVRNSLTIDYLGQHTDPEIAADVKARLQWDVWINGGRIKTAVTNGEVTLKGVIGSALGKSRAFDDAWVSGVISVGVGGLAVDPSVSFETPRGTGPSIISDSGIKLAIQKALGLDPRVSVFSPVVTVLDREVGLDGTVGNLKAKTAAAQDAENVVGVSLVENRLKVRPSGRTTTAAEMEKQLKASLSRDPWLDASNIDAAVINHVAYLSGDVETRFQKAEAQDVASRTRGVLEISNHLKVNANYSVADYDNDSQYDYTSSEPPYRNYNPRSYSRNEIPARRPYQSDRQIKRNIEERFFWSPFLNREDIKVTIDGGVVTLTGTVGNWIGWGEADSDAHNGGATEVLNRLILK